MAAYQVRELHSLGEAARAGLAQLLVDCVEGGASVSFLWPLTDAKAEAFWGRVAEGLARGERRLLVAEDADGRIIGSVQLVFAEPENQPHRADVAKMLVHRRSRRCGVGAMLLSAVERCALEAGRTLLVLDTVSGHDAYRLYLRHGWQRCGEIPGYALWPDGTPCATTVLYKGLAP